MLQNAGNHPDFWIREAGIAASECASYNPCTLCMDAAPRASDSPTLCSDPAPPQECRICRMSRPACSILLLLLLMLKLLLLLVLLLLCWLFAWPLGRVGSLHRVNESEALGAEYMHGVHRSCQGHVRWCKERSSNRDFGIIPCILEHGDPDLLHRLQGFDLEGGAQNHCTGRA